MKLFRCSICNVVVREEEVVKHPKYKHGTCPQDGGKLREITNTKAGKRLIEAFERMEKK